VMDASRFGWRARTAIPSWCFFLSSKAAGLPSFRAAAIHDHRRAELGRDRERSHAGSSLADGSAAPHGRGARGVRKEFAGCDGPRIGGLLEPIPVAAYGSTMRSPGRQCQRPGAPDDYGAGGIARWSRPSTSDRESGLGAQSADGRPGDPRPDPDLNESGGGS